jgi:acylphosphatase
VRNLSDGRSVEAVAQGTMDAVEEFVSQAKTGPPNAVVTSYQTEKLEKAPAFLAFDVK